MTGGIGLIGLGEAGAAFASGLLEAGADVCGYDPRAAQLTLPPGLSTVDSLDALVDRVPVLLNLTSATAVGPIAREVGPRLGPEQLYVDLNSASPEAKRAAAEGLPGFVDGAVMSAVPPKRHKVPILLSGARAADAADALTPFGADIEVLGSEPGQASAVKMLRSLLVKGLEALLVECAAGGARYGVTRRVLASMNGTLPTEDWNELAEYLMTRSLGHGKRRAEELRQVASTLDAAGVEPLLATAGAARLQWLAEQNLAENLTGPDYDAVLERLA